MKGLDNFFRPRTIAVVGASREESKIGHVILKNLMMADFKGHIIPINPNADEILGLKCYPSLLKYKHKIDLVVISVPQILVMKVMQDCKKKRVKNVLIISSGYSEIGNKKDEDKLKEFAKKNKIRVIGPNCLGNLDMNHNVDTLFLPEDKLKRPKKGVISFICQSGAIGSALLDLISDKGHGFSKFISYGNAIDVNETDLLEYLGKDIHTKVICVYLEGIRDGEKFFNACKKIKKPIIILKGGLSEEGAKATLSHTGSLAGKKEVYYGVFKQLNLVVTESLEEMFDIAALFERLKQPRGNKVLVITNGGGYGIISVDDIGYSKNLKMAELSLHTKNILRRKLPKTINIKNPLDLVGDADPKRYDITLENTTIDKNVSLILLEILYQTPTITKEIIQILKKYEHKKPMVIVSTGSEKIKEFLKPIEEEGYITFGFPQDAVNALDKLVGYYKK